ncbi:hypothetical protein DIPPA_34876 [Diplonema papillatum]|nr:hypothetical protein DIPPA_34876 [Diplonema papillatum]
MVLVVSFVAWVPSADPAALYGRDMPALEIFRGLRSLLGFRHRSFDVRRTGKHAASWHLPSAWAAVHCLRDLPRYAGGCRCVHMPAGGTLWGL